MFSTAMDTIAKICIHNGTYYMIQIIGNAMQPMFLAVMDTIDKNCIHNGTYYMIQ